MARAGPMENREIWLQASAILAAHGELSSNYIYDQLDDALGDRIAVEDWLRIAAAIDAINDASHA